MPALTLRLVPRWREGRGKGMAGVEDVRVPTVVQAPLSAGFPVLPPVLLPSSTPAMPFPLWGEGVAVSLCIGQSLSALPPSVHRREAPAASSLDLQQMISPEARGSYRGHGSNQKAGPGRVSIVTPGLSRAVNRLAPVLHSVAPLRVTARRPAVKTEPPPGLRLFHSLL